MKAYLFKNSELKIHKENPKKKIAPSNPVLKIASFRKHLFFKPVAGQKGQVIVEYVLLLVVSTAIALLLINLVSVDPDKGSPVFKYWNHLLEMIGKDIST